MTDHAIATQRRTSAMERYLGAETRLWQHYGSVPRERFVDIARPRARLRVLEAGTGAPVLFLHGTVGPGSWPSLVAGMSGFRCLLLDRPGWGLSTPVEYPRGGYRPYVADLLAALLDSLDIDRVDVVGGSIGDLWALSLAEHHPDRVARVALLGGGPLAPAVPVPPFIRVVSSPIGAIIVRLPVSQDRVRSIVRDSGHGPSLDAGRIPDAFIAWRVANDTQTLAMRHERAMVRRVVDGSAYRPGILFDDDALRLIDAPVLHVFGTADKTGDAGIWQALTTTLPNGSLALIQGAGHMPWFDEPTRVAELVEGFLARSASDPAPLEAAYAGRSRSAGPM
jgi:pimeloyl-ACP methyl ester carboxylesterase